MGAYSNRNFGTFWDFWGDLGGQSRPKGLENHWESIKKHQNNIKNAIKEVLQIDA